MESTALEEYAGPNGAVPKHYAESFGVALQALGDSLFAERERTQRLEARITHLQELLADAVAAERIAADGASALRYEIDLLRAMPWWRRRRRPTPQA